ncbi:MAG: hypothetical protein ACHQIG_01140 [Acidimicrobiia bacterium]
MDRRTYLPPSRVHRALQPPEAVLGSVVDVDGDAVSIVVSVTDEVVRARVCDPDRLQTLLGSADVTRTFAGPLVLCSRSYGVLAVATGPEDAPERVVCMWGVVEIGEGGGAVVIPASGEGQPDWQLFVLCEG